MKRIDVWPYSFRVTCAHNGIGRAYAEPTTYEIEPGDLYRGPKGEVCVKCPECSHEMVLALMVPLERQASTRRELEAIMASNTNSDLAPIERGTCGSCGHRWEFHRPSSCIRSWNGSSLEEDQCACEGFAPITPETKHPIVSMTKGVAERIRIDQEAAEASVVE